MTSCSFDSFHAISVCSIALELYLLTNIVSNLYRLNSKKDQFSYCDHRFVWMWLFSCIAAKSANLSSWSFSAYFLSLNVRLSLCPPFSLSFHRVQLRAKLTMDKVYLALETVAQTAEKNKLENDCREGASELKTTDVSVSQTPLYIRIYICWSAHIINSCISWSTPRSVSLVFANCPCVLAAKMRPSGPEEGPADRTMQRPAEESEDDLQDAAWWVIARRPA